MAASPARQTFCVEGDYTDNHAQDISFCVEDSLGKDKPQNYKRKRIEAPEKGKALGAEELQKEGRPVPSVAQEEGEESLDPKKVKQEIKAQDIYDELEETRKSLAKYILAKIKDKEKARVYHDKLLDTPIQVYSAGIKSSSILQNLFDMGQYRIIVKGMMGKANISIEEMGKNESEKEEVIEKLCQYVSVIGKLVNQLN